MQFEAGLGVNLLAPLPRILEHPEPRGGGEGFFEVLGEPSPLPGEHGALGVGHYGEVPAVGRAETGNARGRTVGVKGVGFRDLPFIVYFHLKIRTF